MTISHIRRETVFGKCRIDYFVDKYFIFYFLSDIHFKLQEYACPMVPLLVKVPQLKRAYFWTPSDRSTGLNKCQNSQPLTQSKFDPCMQWTRPKDLWVQGWNPKIFFGGPLKENFLGPCVKKKKKDINLPLQKVFFFFFLKKISGRTKVKNLTST